MSSSPNNPPSEPPVERRRSPTDPMGLNGDARGPEDLSGTDHGVLAGLLQIRERWKQEAIRQGLLSAEDLGEISAWARKTGVGVEHALVQKGKLTEEAIAQLKAAVGGIVYLDVTDYQIDPQVLQLVPEHVARKHTLLPLYRLGPALTVAMADSWNPLSIDEIRLHAKLPFIQPVLGTATAIRKMINLHYGHRVIEEAAQRPSAAELAPTAVGAPAAPAGGPAPESTQAAGSVAATAKVAEVPVIKLVDTLLWEALDARASDVHLEPDQEHTRVRYRVDGILQEMKLLPIGLHEALVSRIKLMAKLDITEHRQPQEGRVEMTIEGRTIDLRLSVYPTIFGENVVIRLLDRASLRPGLNELGFASDILPKFLDLIHRPHGMVLVTGPTGSGKTTTLYAALTHINSREKNTMTIEDPVEYQLPLVRQTQVNEKAGVAFATGLRSLLRQDPDVIMVGEIRDRETAEIAIHAALTGHLVLSTLHTNDAVSAIPRLMDMGVEPFLLANTLSGVVAQRLVRRICSHCQEGRRPTPEMQAAHPDLKAVYRGRGCRHCRQTGYLGRLGVFELLLVDSRIHQLITTKAPAKELKSAATKAGMRIMREDGFLKVHEGITTVEEMDRLVPPELA